MCGSPSPRKLLAARRALANAQRLGVSVPDEQRERLQHMATGRPVPAMPPEFVAGPRVLRGPRT